MSVDFWLHVFTPVLTICFYAVLQNKNRRSKARSYIIIATFILGLFFSLGKNYAFIIIGCLMIVLDIWETRPKTKYITPKEAL